MSRSVFSSIFVVISALSPCLLNVLRTIVSGQWHHMFAQLPKVGFTGAGCVSLCKTTIGATGSLEIIVPFICPIQAYHLFLIKLLITLHPNPLPPLAATANNRMEREAVKLPPVVLNRPLITPSLDIAPARLVWTSMSFLPSCRISWCSPVSALGWICFKY